MGRKSSGYHAPSPLIFYVLFGIIMGSGACTHKVKIEPSDKPFVVNLNVKVDHEIKVQIEDQNKDLLNLESEIMEKKTPRKQAVKKGNRR
ncbi:MAG: YnbE family lipoprotein [Deltaproteobacteria bacterium]|nr:YnbE family lipoprotein [Deltaproteobacteria bacterium]